MADKVVLQPCVDYLTVTCQKGEQRQQAFELMQDVKRIAEQEREVVRTWRFKGYVGLAIGPSFRWGTRKDSDILMLSGSDANEYWRRALCVARTISRVDLATTVTLGTPWPKLAEQSYQGVLDGMGDAGARARKVSLVVDNRGGSTLYVGSRVSDQFGRLYDKARQAEMSADAYDRVWRYEVEFKGKRASVVARGLHSLGGGSVESAISGTVYHWFVAREVVPVWAKWNDELVLSTEVEAKVTTRESQLAWLSTQVRPTVLRFLKNKDGVALLTALGLTVTDVADVFAI